MSRQRALQVRHLSDDVHRATISMPNGPRSAIRVGVFRLEARGVQLFEAIEGDHFTILGMPLLPLLGALRERGLIAGMIRIALTGSIGMGKSTVAEDVRARRRSGVRRRRRLSARSRVPAAALVEKIGERFPGTVRWRDARPRLLAQIVLGGPAKLAALEGDRPSRRARRARGIHRGHRRCAGARVRDSACCSRPAARRRSTRSSSFPRRPRCSARACSRGPA